MYAGPQRLKDCSVCRVEALLEVLMLLFVELIPVVRAHALQSRLLPMDLPQFAEPPCGSHQEEKRVAVKAILATAPGADGLHGFPDGVLRPAVLVPSERWWEDQQCQRFLLGQVLRWIDDHTPCRAGERTLLGLSPEVLDDLFPEVLLRALLAVLDDQLV